MSDIFDNLQTDIFDEISIIPKKKSSGAGGSFATVGLPNLPEVEKKISQRPDSIQNLITELKTPLPKSETTGIKKYMFTPAKAMKAGVTGLKTAIIPFQKAEAMLAGAGYEIQQGNFVDIPGAIAEGLIGKRQVEFGDLIRTTGFGGGANELLSSTTGFFGSMAIGNLLTKGKIVSGANKIEQTLKNKMPQVMNKDYVLNRTKELVNGVDELEQGIFDNYDELYKAIGDNPVSTSINQADWWKNLPQKAISKIRTILKVPKKDEVIPATVNSLKTIKQALRKSLSRKAWVMPDAEDAKIIEAYFNIGEEISRNAGEHATNLANLNAKAKDFYLLRKELYNILLDSEGQPMANKLINVYKKTGERGKQVFFERLSQFYPKAKDLIDDIVKFNKRQVLKQGIKRATPWIVGGAIGSAIAGKSISSLINRRE